MNPLGYVEAPNGKRAIFPMHDIFLGFTFQNPENWELLRTMINIMIEAYRATNASTTATPILGHITVKTQYQHFLSPQSTPLSQDALKDEKTGVGHPNQSGILYVNLQKLSEDSFKAEAGQLAAHLLGKPVETPLPRVEKVIGGMITSFAKFKTDKDVIEVMTIAEHWQEEAEKIGEARGKAIGEAQGSISAAEELLRLIQEGLTPEQAAEKIRSKYMALV